MIALLLMGQGNFKLNEKWAILRQRHMSKCQVDKKDTGTKCIKRYRDKAHK
jgi:hypothetical protein